MGRAAVYKSIINVVLLSSHSQQIYTNEMIGIRHLKKSSTSFIHTSNSSLLQTAKLIFNTYTCMSVITESNTLRKNVGLNKY